MDILDVMDLIDVHSTIRSNTDSSSLLDDSFTMEPDNLSQSVVMEAESENVVTNQTTPVAQGFTERNLELKLHILSSSSSDSEPEDPTNTTAGTSAGVEGERAASPPPNCAICLGRCKNKCFTDSCMHQFCFKCLCEWSKVKPECPLCKQTFKSIIHNVKSIHQFEEYHVQPPTVQIAHPDSQAIFDVFYPGHSRIQAWNGSTIRPYYLGAAPFSTTSNGGSLPTASGSSGNRSTVSSTNGSGLRNQYVYRGELLDLYRQEYPGAIANSGTLSQLWRRYVYDRKLYALPVADITGRFRESSARFYRDNPSQIHRLMPWINRDVVCLLRQSQHDVTTVLESINSALTLMNILSPGFRRRLQPFLGNKSAHFIHELNNFARSPYDMIGYDRAVQYSPQTNNEEIVIEFSSSDESTENELIDVAGESGGNNNVVFASRTRSTNSSSTNGGIFENDDVGSRQRVLNSYFNPFTAINLTIHNRLTSASANAGDNRGTGISGVSGLGDMHDDVSLVIDLRGESDNNETTSTAQATNNSSNYLNGPNAGTSESDILTSGTQPAVAENIELTSGSSDECEFVLERKPPHLRTPEMVSLDSASDSDVVFVDESRPLNKTTFSSSDEERNNETNDHKYAHRHHNKIAALVQAKKRNQSANLVKSEHQDSHSDVYNLGASTSAALRLSLQKRSEAATSSKKTRRDKYSLRKGDNHTRTERQLPKRRGKRLDSESSHSSTSSSSTTISSSSTNTTSSSKSSTSSGDEDYVVAFHRIKATATERRDSGTRKRGKKVRKSKKLKSSKSSNSRTNKHDLRKRKNIAYSSEDEDEEDGDEGLRGKNYAVVLATHERRKKQDQKNFRNVEEENQPEKEEEEESEGENSWRLKAVNEFLQKQQYENARNSRKANVRKRPNKTSTQHQQQSENRDIQKRQKLGNLQQQGKETKNTMKFDQFKDTSSDESDNINLIQLKTKLTGQEYHKNSNTEQRVTSYVADEAATNSHPHATTNNGNSENNNNTTITSSNAVISATAVIDYETMPSAVAATEEACCSRSNTVDAKTTSANDNAGFFHDESKSTQQQSSLSFSDDSNYNHQNTHQDDPIESKDHVLSVAQHEQPQNVRSSSSANDYANQENPLLRNADVEHNDDDNTTAAAVAAASNNDFCDDDETLSNLPTTTMNLNESNVFADGTSMSTTTTDTILHDAAEQISSAAVNFYNPQQTFNTADFADENSTNSSSSDSSASSSTTSLTSSSNSSSSSAYNYN